MINLPMSNDYQVMWLSPEPEKPEPVLHTHEGSARLANSMDIAHLFRAATMSGRMGNTLALRPEIGRIMRRGPVTMEFLTVILEPLLERSEKHPYESKDDWSPMADTILLDGLAHQNCPTGLLERACHNPNGLIRNHAARNPDCPESARVYAFLMDSSDTTPEHGQS